MKIFKNAPSVSRVGLLWVLSFSALFLCSFNTIGQTDIEHNIVHAVFINPSSPGDPYWDLYTQNMKVAAATLGVDLQVEYAEGSRYRSVRIARNLLNNSYRPDYLVYIYQQESTHRILKLAESAKVKSFIVNTNISEEDRRVIGVPRGKYSQWIGHVHPENILAGAALAEKLNVLAIEKSLKDKNGQVQMLAISGSKDSSAGLDYNKGMEVTVKLKHQLKLNQLVFAEWKREKASIQAEGLLYRYPETAIIWTVGEDVLLGALDGAKKANKTPGSDIVLGGSVSSAVGIDAVMRGKAVANMGMDAFEGAYILVKIYDYHNGNDIGEQYTLRYKTQFVTQESVAPYYELISKERWRKINYKQLTQTHTGILKTFDVHSLLKAAQYETDKKE